MNDSERDRVLLRVKKMMTLANDAAATEGERDNALRMAHATLAKYNLTMTQADSASSEEKRQQGEMTALNYPWVATVASAIANLFFCNMFMIKPRGNQNRNQQIFFVGKASNVFTAQEMSKYVIESIMKEGRNAAKAAGEAGGGTFWRSFCKGASHRLHSRCKEIRAAAEKAPPVMSSGTSLVLSSLYESERQANADFIARVLNLRLKSGSGRERGSSHDAYQQGRAYGDRVGLSPQVRGGGSGLKQIK